jgi:enoyl-CoA hydratase
LLGERLEANEARDAGIVNKVVPHDEVDGAVAEWAAMLAARSPLIMRLGKDAMWRQMDMDLADALDYLRSQLAIELSTEDAIEGVKAFFEKREPEWKGR